MTPRDIESQKMEPRAQQKEAKRAKKESSGAESSSKNAPKEAKIGQYKPKNPFYCNSSQINSMVAILSDFQFPELIQVGCRRNGSEIFINRKGDIIVDGKRSSIRVQNHDTCVVQVINEEAEEARKSRRTQCWEENIP